MNSTIVNSLVLLGDSIPKFKALLSPIWWINVRAAVINTRSYEEGLMAVERLKALNEIYREQGYLTEADYKEYERSLFMFNLELLDKADRWEEFIDLFEALLQKKNLSTRKYDPCVMENPDVLPYVVETGRHFVYVHPLWWLDYRYKMILRKIEKRAKSKTQRIKNVQHKLQSDLTEQEIQRRFMSVIQASERGESVPFSGYY